MNQNNRSAMKSVSPEATIEASPSDFSFTITKVAVAQVCKSAGFRRTQQSALNALTSVATKYLETLARSTAEFSNAANRTQSNLVDIANALHDLYAVQGGFLGASSLNVNNCLLKSSVLKDLSDFVNSTEEIPFAKPIHGGKAKEREEPAQQNSEKRHKHIPEWLPAFPEMVSREECSRRVELVELWENSGWASVSEGDGGAVEGKSIGNGGELMKERARVSFRIGGGKKVGMKSRIRELLEQREEEDDDDDKISTFLQKLRRKKKKQRAVRSRPQNPQGKQC